MFFDPDKYENNMPVSGAYSVVVDSVTVKENKEMGSLMYQLACTLVDSRWAGFSFAIPMMVKHMNPKSQAIGIMRMKELCMATSQRPYAETEDELCGKVVCMDLTVNPESTFKITINKISPKTKAPQN